MSKHPTKSKERDDRSLDAARQGVGVSVRLALLRLFDPPQGDGRGPKRWWFRAAVAGCVVVVASHIDGTSEILQILPGP